MRITEKDLKAVLARINRSVGLGEAPAYSTVGAYTLDWAYGGVRLDRYVNDKGGVECITNGYSTKRELYNMMQAYSLGLENSK